MSSILDLKENGLLCPIVVHENKTTFRRSSYDIKDSLNTKLEKLLSKLNSYLWFDSKELLMTNI